jgi:hypothetical protein
VIGGRAAVKPSITGFNPVRGQKDPGKSSNIHALNSKPRIYADERGSDLRSSAFICGLLLQLLASEQFGPSSAPESGLIN